MEVRQEINLSKLGRKIGLGMSPETLSQIRAEVKKLDACLDELEDSFDKIASRVIYLETYLEDDWHEDSL